MKLRVWCLVLMLALLAACGAAEPETATPDSPPLAGDTETPVQSEPPADDDAARQEASRLEDKTEPVATDAPPDPPAPKPKPTPPPPPAPVDPGPHPGLLDPSRTTETAPAEFRVKFETTRGDVVLQIHRDWAPRGADRFFNLVKIGFFTDIAVFRVIKEPRPFMAQFGIHGDPRISAAWDKARIQDDPGRQTNSRGRITFATAGPNTRTTQFFINFGDNGRLDQQGFSPFGEVIEGMDVVDSLYAGYGEGAPRGLGPSQGLLSRQGNSYLKQEYPQLDYIKKASLMK